VTFAKYLNIPRKKTMVRVIIKEIKKGKRKE
jgi:hypothetical protein